MTFFVNKNRKFKTLLILSFLFGFYANINSGFLDSFLPFKGIFKSKKVWSGKKLISNPVFLTASGGIILCAGLAFLFYVCGDGLDSNSRKIRVILNICDCRRIEDMKRILDEGFEINTIDRYGRTALSVACSMESIDIVKLLIDRGANIDLANESGRTSLHISAESGRDNIVRFLVSKGASIDKADYFGETPLHLALRQSKFDVVKFLVEGGADVNKENIRGKSCLDLAIEKCDQEFLRSVFKIVYRNMFLKNKVSGMPKMYDISNGKARPIKQKINK